MSKYYNIKWQEADSRELSKAVKNFNAKISRLEKKNPELKNLLPERVTVKEMKELIDTRQDLKRELNSLKRFSKRGSEQLVTIPDNDYNLQITKWQKNEMTRRVGVINRKRAQRLEQIQNIELKSRGEKLGYTRGQLGMGKADEIALTPLNTFTKRMTRHDLKRKFETIKRESQSTYWQKREMIMKDSYIKSLERNFPADEISDVVKAIDDMTFEEFYKTFQEEGADFELSYPLNKDDERKAINALKAIWTPNKKGA